MPNARPHCFIRELEKEGFNLAQGKALDLIAKLQGHRNWNVYCRAEKLLPAETPAAVENAPNCSYAIAIPPELVDKNGQVSDIRLAVHLGHPRNSVTTLLEHAVGDESYALRLCEGVRGTITDQADRRYQFDSGKGIGCAMLQAMDDTNNRVDFQNNPWFEWVNRDGDAVGEPFSDIALCAQKEVDSLLAMIA